MFRALVRSRLSPIIRKISASPWVRILTYHRFGVGGKRRRLDRDRFEEHLRFITRYYRPRRLDEVIRFIQTGRTLGERNVVVTIDDGYSDFSSIAYPLLRKYKIPATVFLVTDFMNGAWFWWDAIWHILHAIPDGIVSVAAGELTFRLDLTSPAARERSWEDVANACVYLDVDQQLGRVRSLQEQLGVRLPEHPAEDFAPMSWDEVLDLDPELIEIGSHTCSHPILSLCNDARLEWEILESKRVLESRLGREVRSFCYPNGQARDYDDRATAILEAGGYTCAVVGNGGLATPTDALYRLPRLPAPDDLGRFQGTLDGVLNLRQILYHSLVPQRARH